MRKFKKYSIISSHHFVTNTGNYSYIFKDSDNSRIQIGRRMVNITERAAKALVKLLHDTVDIPQARLRIVDRGQGTLGLGIDIEAPSDYIVEYKGSSVLVVEKKLAESLKETTLDIEESPEGPEFVFLCPAG